MSVNTMATLQYDNVMMNNDMTIASGMSLVGFLASSPIFYNSILCIDNKILKIKTKYLINKKDMQKKYK